MLWRSCSKHSEEDGRMVRLIVWVIPQLHRQLFNQHHASHRLLASKQIILQIDAFPAGFYWSGSLSPYLQFTFHNVCPSRTQGTLTSSAQTGTRLCIYIKVSVC